MIKNPAIIILYLHINNLHIINLHIINLHTINLHIINLHINNLYIINLPLWQVQWDEDVRLVMIHNTGTNSSPPYCAKVCPPLSTKNSHFYKPLLALGNFYIP